jgi:hypothetical protein
LLGDNIAYLFCDSINLPYTGLTVDDMGVVQSHAGVKSWNPPSRNYRDRPSAVSYSEVKGSNDTINTDRRYRINKSVFVDGLYQDLRGSAVGYYDTNFVADLSLIIHPDNNCFYAGDSITIDEFDHSLNPTYTGNCNITSIQTISSQGPFEYAPDPTYTGPWLRINTDMGFVNSTNNEAGIIYISGGTYYNYDIPVGFVILDMGLVVITHKDIVNNIDWTAGYLPDGTPNPGTGASGTTNIYFDDYATTIYGDYEPRSIMNFTTLDTVFQMKATCNCLLGEFFISNNSTWDSRTIGQPLAEDDPVSVTEVGLYNELNELVGVTKFSEPILKGALDLLTFEIDINL